MGTVAFDPRPVAVESQSNLVVSKVETEEFSYASANVKTTTTVRS